MRRASLLRLVGLALIWGSSFLWIKLALRSLSPGEVVAVRLALGALVLYGVLKVRGERLPEGANVWLHLGVAALVANVVPFALFAYGERQVDSAIAGILNATTPLWTILVALAVRQERQPTAAKLVGIAVGFAGTVVIFSPWRHASQVMSWGGLACLVAAALYGFTFVYITHFLAGCGLSPYRLAAGAAHCWSGHRGGRPAIPRRTAPPLAARRNDRRRHPRRRGNGPRLSHQLPPHHRRGCLGNVDCHLPHADRVCRLGRRRPPRADPAQRHRRDDGRPRRRGACPSPGDVAPDRPLTGSQNPRVSNPQRRISCSARSVGLPSYISFPSRSPIQRLACPRYST